jgi:hypothetical protein
MKKFLFLFFFISSAVIISSWMCPTANHKGKRKFLVSGSIMQTISYCGGAQPPQRLLDSMNVPKGIPYGKLFVKLKGGHKEGSLIIHTIKADTNGNFSIYLPAGNYCLVEEWKTKPFKLPLNNVNETVDSTCFKNLYNTCDYELNVTDKNVRHLKIIFHRPCYNNQPCISYHGALRP